MAPVTKYRLVLGFFMVGLILSGITAFPLAWELQMLTHRFGIDTATPPASHTGVAFWLATVDQGLHQTYAVYPWIGYGTDWLAFAHIVIAVYFVGPWINPVKNEWVIHAGLIGCLLVLPLALICGSLRGIPFYWRLIDCSFGVFGSIPLLYCLRLTRQIRMRPDAVSSGFPLAS